jgi:hypothetical protein
MYGFYIADPSGRMRCSKCLAVIKFDGKINKHMEHKVSCSIGEYLEIRMVEEWIDETVELIRES